jgi:Zinc knuckle
VSESRSKGNNLSLTDLGEAMTQLWRATYGKGGGYEQDDAKDIVMAAPTTWRTPQRNNNWRGSGSNWRGGRGHYGNNNGGRGKPRDMTKVVCYSCGKIGHFAMDCRSKPNGNNGNEVGAVAAMYKNKNNTLKTHDIMLCSVTQILAERCQLL